MRKRVCETCRWFVEAGFAKSGWCNHPQRKPSSDVKIVVRRVELACRNGWSQDLWEPKTEADGDTDVVLQQPTVSARPLPPITLEEMTSVVNSQRDRQEPETPPPAVDVVVGEAPASEPAQPRPSLLTQDARAAILKARERYRERMRKSRPFDVAPAGFEDAGASGSLTSGATGTDRSSETTRGSSASGRPSADAAPAVPPVRLDELPRTFPTITTFPEDEERFSTVPEPTEGVALPRPPAVERPKRYRASDIPDEEPSYEPEEPTARATADVRASAPVEPASRSQRLAPPLWRNARRPAPKQQDVEWDEPLVDEVTDDEPIEFAPEEDVWEESRYEARELPVAEEEAEPDYILGPGDDEVEPIEAEQVDLMPWVAPELPRACRTCRDFRPTEGGERGWCNNKWAFRHRRMVDAEELPCLTSIGCWWLPHDDIWLEKADIAAHGLPTPLTDQLLGPRSVPSQPETATGQGRRGRR